VVSDELMSNKRHSHRFAVVEASGVAWRLMKAMMCQLPAARLQLLFLIRQNKIIQVTTFQVGANDATKAFVSALTKWLFFFF